MPRRGNSRASSRGNSDTRRTAHACGSRFLYPRASNCGGIHVQRLDRLPSLPVPGLKPSARLSSRKPLSRRRLPAASTSSSTRTKRMQCSQSCEKRAAGTAVADADWEHLFATEPYIRLKKREAGMHRRLSPTMISRSLCSRRTWPPKPPRCGTRSRPGGRPISSHRHERVLAYLPEQAHIRAKVFPVIKPKTNSFVFETTHRSSDFPLSRSGRIGSEVREHSRARIASHRLCQRRVAC